MSLDDIRALDLLAAFPEPALVMTPNGALIYTNQAANQLLEVEVSPIDRNITEFLPEKERSRLDPLAWMQRWAQAPNAPELEHVHLLCQTAAGKEKPVRVRVGQVRDGEDVYYVVMLHDITEAQNRQHQERRAHRLAAQLLAISADAIVTTDQRFDITYANQSAERLFGYGSGELVGKPLSVLLPEPYREAHGEHIRRFATETRPARLMGERNVVPGQTKSGEQIPLQASIAKITMNQEIVFSAQLRRLDSTTDAATPSSARASA